MKAYPRIMQSLQDESPNHGIGGYALCVGDGGIAACAFQAGAILALWDRGLLGESRILSASGSGISLVTMLLQATCTQKEQDPWSRQEEGASDETKQLLIDGRQSPEQQHFLSLVRTYCTTNWELGMLRTRLCRPWRWLSTNLVPDYQGALQKTLHSSDWLRGGQLTTDKRELPVVLFASELQTRPEQTSLLIATNDLVFPRNPQGLDVDFVAWDVKAPVIESTASIILPAAFGGNPGHDRIPRAATRLDPLGLRGAQVYAMRRKLAARKTEWKESKQTAVATDRLLMLDGFTKSNSWSKSTSVERLATRRTLSDLVLRPDGTCEDLRAYKQQVVSLARAIDELDLLPEAWRADLQRVAGYDWRLTSLPEKDFVMLVRSGYACAYAAYADKVVRFPQIPLPL